GGGAAVAPFAGAVVSRQLAAPSRGAHLEADGAAVVEELEGLEGELARIVGRIPRLGECPRHRGLVERRRTGAALRIDQHELGAVGGGGPEPETAVGEPGGAHRPADHEVAGGGTEHALGALVVGGGNDS